MSPIAPASAAMPSPDDIDLDDDAVEGDAAVESEGSLVFDDNGFSTVSTTTTHLHGDFEGLTLDGDGGDSTINVYGTFSGTINGGDGDDVVVVKEGGAVNDSEIRGGKGDDQFVAESGSEVRDSEIRGGDGDDVVDQKEGSTFVDTELYGGDDADVFSMAGHQEGTTRIDLGNNGEKVDAILMMPTVTGSVLALDPDHSELDVKHREVSDHDAVKLINDASRGLTWVEQEDGSFGLSNADGEIVADLTAGGNEKSIENIASYDINGGVVEQFRDIEPEKRFSSPFAKYAGEVLSIAGMFVPALLPVAAAFKIYHAADNNMLSWENGLQMGLSAIPAGATMTYVMNGVRAGHAIVNEDWAGALINGAGLFGPGATQNFVYGAGQTWRAAEAIEAGEYDIAASSLANAATAGGFDADGTVVNVLKTTSHVSGGIELFGDGQHVGAVKQFYQAGNRFGDLFEGEDDRIELTSPDLTLPDSALPENHTVPPETYAPGGEDLQLGPGGIFGADDASGPPEVQFSYLPESDGQQASG